MIRVAVIDDHQVVHMGIASLPEVDKDLAFVTAVKTVEEFHTAGVQVDVVLLDLRLDDSDPASVDGTLEAIPTLIETGATVLLYTSEQRPVPLRRAVAAGVAGVLLKSDPVETIADGIREATDGNFYCSGTLAHALLTDDLAVAALSERQVDILRALADGHDYRGAARLLQITESALKTYLARARNGFKSIGIEPGNAMDLVRLAKRQGHLDR